MGARARYAKNYVAPAARPAASTASTATSSSSLGLAAGLAPRRALDGVRAAFRWYSERMASSPFVTNAVTAGVLGCIADVSAQAISRGDGEKFTVDVRRMLTTASFNVALSPFARGWFMLLDRFFPGVMLRNVLSKIIVNQSIFSTLANTIFFSWTIALRDQPATLGEFKERVGDKLSADLAMTQARAWAAWPAFNYICFTMCPLHLRVVMMNAGAVAWTVVLSYTAHRGCNNTEAAAAPAPSSVVIEELATM